MQRTLISAFAAAALLSMAAGGSATAKTESSFLPPSEPLRLGGIGRPAAATDPASPDRSFRTAFTYIELLVVKANKKKNLRANQQSGNRAKRPAGKSR